MGSPKVEVSLWHKADIPSCQLFVRFWGEADISRRMAQIISAAFDPKRTKTSDL